MTELRPDVADVEEVIAALRPGTLVQVKFLGQPPAAYRCITIPGSEPSTVRVEPHPELLDRATIRGLQHDLDRARAHARETSSHLRQLQTELVNTRQRLRRAEFALTGLSGLIQDGAAICQEVLDNQLAGPPLRQLAARIRSALTPPAAHQPPPANADQSRPVTRAPH